MTVLSLFSGIGGLDLGIRLALPDARVVAYVEKDPYCRQVLAARMRDGGLDEAPIYEDVTTFDTTPYRGTDLVCGGFPCQDISNAGRRQGITGSRSGLWGEMARIIGAVGPRYVFVENVRALLVRGMGRVLGELSDLGYNAEWCCVSAADVGAPHLRQRVFLLAYSQCAQRGANGRCRDDGGEGQDGARQGADRSGMLCSPLAYAPSARNGTQPGSALGDAAGNGRRTARGEQPEGSNGNLAHADLGFGEQPPRRGTGPAEAAGGWAHGQLTGPGDDVFPPGPADRDGWARFLAHSPHLEPALRKADAKPPLCDVADGSPDWLGIAFTARVDQLRCLGNAVVPAAAALAFKTLMARIDDQGLPILPQEASEI